MLAFHNFTSMRKRTRDDDDSDSDGERYLKKTRPWSIQTSFNGSSNYLSSSALPLRTPFTPSPESSVPHLDAMTPASEQSEANSPASIEDEPYLFSPRHNSMDVDMGMDDDLDIINSQPPDSPMAPFHLRPAKLNPDLFSSGLNNTGRMPTPIYPTFHAPRGTGMAGLGYPSSGLAGGSHSVFGVSNPDNHPILQPPPPRKQPQLDQDRSRRMPSPISEDEDLPDTPTALTQSQLSRLSVTSHTGNPPDSMDTEGNADMTAQLPGAGTTPTRGRKRSGAFTGKGRFSMGYRDDCEKCRARIPGHYSHFLS
ncbi:hypothetical protein CC78DRAFT_576604 [Lojkania enalia]|uniref:Uncharacterized protein n=1 Tax=Lojkania enalia TaxID=147567 RepID=A0A9P4KHV4_9PLEO|nr:hypothetical protein CC78DRAFT_576604 [Didymosphaeria enalia]